MENGDLLGIHGSEAEEKGRGAVESRILFIEEEVSDEIIGVNLANISAKHLE